MPESDVIEFVRTQLTLPDKPDPADEMSWQHYLYSKLGKTETSSEELIEKPPSGATEKTKTKEQIIQETVERIVAMAKVLYGLHMVRLNRWEHHIKEALSVHLISKLYSFYI